MRQLLAIGLIAGACAVAAEVQAANILTGGLLKNAEPSPPTQPIPGTNVALDIPSFGFAWMSCLGPPSLGGVSSEIKFTNRSNSEVVIAQDFIGQNTVAPGDTADVQGNSGPFGHNRSIIVRSCFSVSAGNHRNCLPHEHRRSFEA